MATVSSGGVFLKATIAAGGSALARSGAAVQKATVHGTLKTFAGVAAADVKSGGLLLLQDGAASDVLVRGGARERIEAGAADAGARIYGVQQVLGTASAAAVKNGGSMRVFSGGLAVSAKVSSGGLIAVDPGASVSALTLASGGRAQIDGGKLTGTTTLNGGVLAVAAAGVNVGRITGQASATVTYDISGMKAGAATAMLTESTKQVLDTRFSIVTAGLQEMGAYRLSSRLILAAGKRFALYRGTAKIGAATLGKAKTLNGVTYKVTQAGGAVKLTLSAVAGKFKIGNDRANTLTGTTLGDIFYGGRGNDTITGVNGRDVAVDDRNNWGRDTIAATGGTMTLVLAGITKSRVTQTLSNGTMTIRRNGTGQSITVTGWSADTHRIVYGAKLPEFTAYAKAASPSEAQKQAAKNEVWQKAGLARA
jgi:autotransporter passenger strand-loop-strand repeat protein